MILEDVCYNDYIIIIIIPFRSIMLYSCNLRTTWILVYGRDLYLGKFVISKS